MEKYKRIMVGLDLTEADLPLIAYSAYIAEISGAESVYFVHVVNNLELEDLHASIGELGSYAPVDEQRKDQMAEEVRTTFENHSHIETNFEVIEGNTLKEMLHWAMVKHINLIMVGRKPEEHTEHLISEKLARKAPCSVMIIPRDTVPLISKILLPVDFSEHSKVCMDEAISIANIVGGVKISALNVYRVPIGYYKLGKTYEEFAEIMHNNARKHSEDFMKKIDTKGTDITPVFKLEDEKAPAKYIIDYANTHEFNLLMIGSKGRTGAAAILLGSVAEKLIKEHLEIPLLVVKIKDENMGFLQALLKV